MTLRAKVLLVLLPLMLACGLAAARFSRGAVYRTLVGEAARSALAVMGEAADTLQPGAAARSEKRLLPALIALQRRLGANAVFFIDENGNVVAHTNVAEVGAKTGDAFARSAVWAAGETYAETGTDAAPELSLARPLTAGGSAEDQLLSAGGASTSRRLGTLVVRLPLRDYLRLYRTISGRLLWIIAGLMLFVAAGTLLLLELALLRPVKALTAATERVRHGDYGVLVPAYGRDELGRLAGSFNRMSAGLAETTVSRDYLDGLLRSLPDAVLVADDKGRVTMVNPAAASLLGRPAEALHGLGLGELFAGGAPGWLPGAMAGGTVNGAEDTLLRVSGDQVPVLVSASTLGGKNGRGGLVAAVRDITERKRMEASLLQTEKMSAIGVLAAGVAHEINNPLGIILGFAQYAARHVKPEDPLHEPVTTIEREAQRCKTLVRSLLVFSRATRNEQWGDVDLNAALAGALTLVEAQAKRAGVTLIAEAGKDLPALYADGAQLQQVIINLASNAIDAMPGGGTLTIRTLAAAGGAALQVADTGTGIPEEVRGRIFEPFFSTKEIGKGTGLGLSLVYEIVHKHSGSIEFRTEPGGTVFTVNLPAKAGVVEGEARA